MFAQAWIVLALLLGFLLFLPTLGIAAELALDGGWRPSDAGEAATSVGRDDSRLRPFDPARRQAFVGGENGSWVLLWPAHGHWPQAPWMLDVKSPGLQTLHWFPPGGTPHGAQLLRPEMNAWPGHGQLAFLIDTPLADGEPIRLHVDARDVIPSTMNFIARTVAEHLRADARWLAFASACFAIMVGMAVMAFVFGLRLRDPAFLYYALFVLAYAMILVLQTGYVIDPLGWYALAGAPRVWGRIATMLSVVFAVLFLDRFANLRRYVPTGRRLLLAYAAAIIVLSALRLLPTSQGDAVGRALINPLLVLGGPLLLCLAVLAAWRGSRYARFFLLGWTPLLATTVLSSLQLAGFASAWTWSDEAALGAGALEALVLSLGLADRSLALRRDRDQARRLADTDALTGLYNRRAWTERVFALDEAMRGMAQPLSVLFLDLDHFKELNDRHGHQAGDTALRELAAVMREELREQDIVGRYGGEEFVVALPDAGHAHALLVADRIRRRLQEKTGADFAHTAQTVSIGAATLLPGEDLMMLLKRADEAMYAAKAAGRNRVVFADAESRMLSGAEALGDV